MSIPEALKALLVDAVLCPLTIEKGQNTCILQEYESDYQFKLRHLPKDALVIKCDKFPQLGDIFFKGDNMECKRADYALISESCGEIMIFELKRSRNSAGNKEIYAQLKGAKCIVEYCKSIVDSFFNEINNGKGFYGFAYKYYIVQYKTSVKRSFSNIEKPDNRTPENARRLGGSFASFGDL